MHDRALALIAAKPGRWRESLRALLIAAPEVDAVREVSEPISEHEAEEDPSPALVVLDASLDGIRVPEELQEIKELWPHSRCIVLVDNSKQQQQAQYNGADAVLMRGFSAGELFTAVDRLLVENFGAGSQV
jgi:DNA-binding NarL/FixJ family response regulator